jgi:uncharacterized protein YgbK (DUF1537 family)
VKCIVLDDDPTGTQCASDVTVLLGLDEDAATMTKRLVDVLPTEDAFYVLTNSRALEARDAVALVTRIRDAAIEAATLLDIEIPQFVLRGDSTLRGHVFPESDAFSTGDSVLLFVPAFPAGGRTTENSVHYVQVGSDRLPAAQTEYASDPVFGFRSSDMEGHVAERGGARDVVSVRLDRLRDLGGQAVADALVAAPPGAVVAPDAVTDDDVALVHAGLNRAVAAGREVVVRCAAPLAALCAGVFTDTLLPRPLTRSAGPALVVCGSHTSGASAQLQVLEAQSGLQRRCSRYRRRTRESGRGGRGTGGIGTNAPSRRRSCRHREFAAPPR